MFIVIRFFTIFVYYQRLRYVSQVFLETILYHFMKKGFFYKAKKLPAA